MCMCMCVGCFPPLSLLYHYYPNSMQAPTASKSFFKTAFKALESLQQHLNIGPLFLDPEAGKEGDSYGFGFLGKVFESNIN